MRKQNSIHLITIIGSFAAAGLSAAIVVDFDSNTVGDTLTNGFGSIKDTINASNTQFVKQSGASLSDIFSRGTSDNYVRLSRTYREGQAVTVSSLFDLATFGLSTGQAYSLQFDYIIDAVGTATIDENSEIRYGVFEDDGAYGGASGVAVSLNDFSADDPNGSAINLNYSGSTPITTSSAVGWTTFTSTQSITFSAGAKSGGFVISGMGFGTDNSDTFDVANYSYFGIDNVEFVAVPEPGTFAVLAGFGALGLVLLRRRVRNS